MASNTHGGRRSQIANYILITAAVLLLLAYPFQDFFVGGLLTHLAGAALIGGLADWYAVTALFRRPLGISFKTALIPNSKERIAETSSSIIPSWARRWITSIRKRGSSRQNASSVRSSIPSCTPST